MKSNEVRPRGRMSEHLELLSCVYIDACNKCIADVSDLRDLETIRSRVEMEGMSFLTITLPNFCKDFERSLADGYIDPTKFRNFRKFGSIPAFLRGMIGLVFNHETGRIYDDSSENWIDFPSIIESVRQICLTFKKVEEACTPKRVQAAIQNYTAIEQSFDLFSLSDSEYRAFDLVSNVLWGNVMANLCLNDVSPRHGPGTTAESISGNQKYVWRTWHERLEPYFPILENAYTLGAYESRELKEVTVVKPEQELPVKVVTVPKTLKGPRIIAIEPVCMQYAQQAIRRSLYAAIESHDLTAGHVNFRDQSINQGLAVDASRTGLLATIDLSDASDRVPLELALLMFRSNPDLQDAVAACRTTRAQLPNGRVIPDLRKFASMGSALCFPVEAMYFYTLCVMALLWAQNLPVSHENIFQVSRDIHVYGDDIVVPTTYAITVLAYLRKYNCKVNSSKTFVSGNFRESCGDDAYRGYLVTPVYLRKLRPKNRRQASELISWVSTANSFYKKGYWNVASHMFKICEKIIGPLPYVSPESQALGRVSFLGYRSAERWNRDFHRYEVKAMVPRPVYRSDMIDGYSALMKSFHRIDHRSSEEWWSLSSLDKEVSQDVHHLERSALRGAVVLQRRWVPALF